MTYDDTVIPKAAEAYAKMDKARKISKLMFVTLSEWSGGQRMIRDATLEASLDEAALESIRVQDYAGTVMIDIDGKATMLDLRAHGEALQRENETDRILEIAHEQENRRIFNER